MLRSLLPQPLIAAVAVPSPPQDPATSHGAGAVPSGPILDFDKDGAMALMGVLYVVLALILVNGRRLPDGVSRRSSPASPSAGRPRPTAD